MKTIEGDLTIKNKKIAIIAGRFNSFIVEHLISGAKEALLKHGADDSDIDLLYLDRRDWTRLCADCLEKVCGHILKSRK